MQGLVVLAEAMLRHMDCHRDASGVRPLRMLVVDLTVAISV
jgi:hypothetical protein